MEQREHSGVGQLVNVRALKVLNRAEQDALLQALVDFDERHCAVCAAQARAMQQRLAAVTAMRKSLAALERTLQELGEH